MSDYDYKIFGVPGEAYAVDTVAEVAGQLVGRYSGKTLDELRAENPTAELLDVEDFRAKRNAALVTEPEEITKERFIDMLEVLPPEDWRRDKNTESFKMCEYYSGNITSFYARIGDKYYTFRDDAAMQHSAIIAKITAHIEAMAN